MAIDRPSRFAKLLLMATAFTWAQNHVSSAQENPFSDLPDPTHCGATQVGFFGDTMTAVESGHIYYRIGSGPWQMSKIEGIGHSLTRLPNGKWLMNDTGHHHLVQFDNISGDGEVITRSELGGVAISGPHDQIVDSSTGYIYVIDGNRRLYRFKDLNGPADVWTFTPEQLGYARSLSWFDNHLHVIDSSRGEVVRIDDYDSRRFTIFRSPRPKSLPKNPYPAFGYGKQDYGEHDYMGGALYATGLVLIDVDKAGDWYYGTNLFRAQFAFGTDVNAGRLIRWKSWEEFEQGKWEDISSSFPKAPTPYVGYFITIHDGSLYLPISNYDTKCQSSVVYRLDPAVLPEAGLSR